MQLAYYPAVVCCILYIRSSSYVRTGCLRTHEAILYAFVDRLCSVPCMGTLPAIIVHHAYYLSNLINKYIYMRNAYSTYNVIVFTY